MKIEITLSDEMVAAAEHVFGKDNLAAGLSEFVESAARASWEPQRKTAQDALDLEYARLIRSDAAKSAEMLVWLEQRKAAEDAAKTADANPGEEVPVSPEEGVK